MTLAARHGELAGHMHGYEPKVVARGVMQTIANRRLTYLALPDEAVVGNAAVIALLESRPGGRCWVPWRDEAKQFTYYCLLERGHDDEAAAGPFATAEELEANLAPEHGWYRLLDAYDRGAQAMSDAADRIEARRQAALGRTISDVCGRVVARARKVDLGRG